jgi:hypothetical protein
MAIRATTIVMAPSMINSQRLEKSEYGHFCHIVLLCTYHARSPSLPSIFPVIPAAIKPEKAPEINDPEYRAAVRNPSSFLVYHALRK